MLKNGFTYEKMMTQINSYIEKYSVFSANFIADFFDVFGKNQSMKAKSCLLVKPVLLSILVMAWLTVDSEVWSAAEISLTVKPKAESLAISRSLASRAMAMCFSLT